MEVIKLERDGICRGCDIILPKHSDVFYTYSSANRGQNIFFCLDCVDTICKLKEKLDERYKR